MRLTSALLGFYFALTSQASVNFCHDFYSRKIYDYSEVAPHCAQGNCNINVILMANVLLEQGISKEEIRFIMIRPQNRNDNVYPKADISNTESWGFHAVIQIGKFILDLDHRNYGQPIRVDQYMKEMFGHNNLDFKTIDTLSFTYEQYMDSQNRNKNLSYIYNLNLNKIPSIPLSKYLTDLGFKPEVIQTSIRPPLDTHKISRTEYGIRTNHEIFSQFKKGNQISFSILKSMEGGETSISGAFDSLHPRFVRIIERNGTPIDVPLAIIYTDTISKIN